MIPGLGAPGLAGRKYLGHSQLSFYGRFILQSPDRPGSIQHYQEYTFTTIPDTLKILTHSYSPRSGEAKTGEKRNKSLEMKETLTRHEA